MNPNPFEVHGFWEFFCNKLFEAVKNGATYYFHMKGTLKIGGQSCKYWGFNTKLSDRNINIHKQHSKFIVTTSVWVVVICHRSQTQLAHADILSNAFTLLASGLPESRTPIFVSPNIHEYRLLNKLSGLEGQNKTN